MSALAELFVRRGVAITGCDANPGPADDLRRVGIDVLHGHDPRHVESARALVVTSAMRRDHPELVRARELGIPVIRRAEALGEAVAGGRLVGIAGTHGKTTTTVMTTEALAAAGLGPTGIVGGRVGAWGGNMKPGGESLFVVEADEYDRSFLALAPTIAVVTNVEADHLDIYADLADIRGAFEQFVGGATTVVLCADDRGATTLAVPAGTRVIRYGLNGSNADLRARDIRAKDAGQEWEVVFEGRSLGRAAIGVPGAHNVRNALAAIASGIALGARLEQMTPGLASFGGVERRFERLGEARGVTVVDDYAHHPTEIRATLEAARAAFPERRLIAAFQPHLFTRTRDFAREFGEALAGADVVYLTEIYPAREQPIPGVTADLIEKSVRSANGTIGWRGDRAALAEALAAGVRERDVVLTIGAGDITLTGPELLALLGDR
jgi:UDP-N-acetylmuramate--alanine ligase